MKLTEKSLARGRVDHRSRRFHEVPIAVGSRLARDVMLAAPDTVPDTATVASARTLLSNPRLRVLLVTRGRHFVGTVSRTRLAEEADGERLLCDLVADDDARVRPDDPVSEVLARLERVASGRIPVVADGDRLVGLICLNRRNRRFCVDAGEP